MSGIQADLLEAAVAALPADGLAASRKAAASRFVDSGMPTTRHEDWRYTDLKPAISVSNDWLARFAGSETAPHVEANARIDELRGQIDAHWVIVRNGIVDDESVESLNAAGVEVARLGNGVDTSLFDAVAPLSALNGALLRDGIRLRTSSGMALDKPVGLLLVDDATNGPNVTQSRILLDLAQDSGLQVLECQLSLGDQEQFANTLMQVAMARGAKLDLVRLQQRRRTHLNVNRLDVRLEQDAALSCASFDFGGALVRNDITADILAPGASVTLHGLYLASGRQHIDNHTRVDHRVGPAVSHEEYRGILTGESRCVFNGKAVVYLSVKLTHQ